MNLLDIGACDAPYLQYYSGVTWSRRRSRG